MCIAKMRSDGSTEELPISVDTVLKPGERLLSQGCGGGGFGDPLLRDAERVREDVVEGFISLQRARDAFGVILDADSAVDHPATLRKRQALKARRATS